MSLTAANINGAPVPASIAKLNARATSGADAKSATQTVVLRVPAGLLARLDGAVANRAVRVPRHTWLLEAISEKLERENTSLQSGNGGRAPRGRRHGT